MKKFTFKKWGGIFKKTFESFVNDRVLKFSAALAYYTIFSLPPMLIVIISVAGWIYGREAIEGKVFAQIADLVGQKPAFEIQEMIKKVSLTGKTQIATYIGLATLFIGATGVFSEIQDSINTIWGIKAKPNRGLKALIVNRLLSFSMVLSIGFLLLVSLVVNALIAFFESKLSQLLPGLSVYILFVLNYAVTFASITLLFGTIYKVLPDAKIAWKDVIIGAIATSVLFMIGKFAIGLYLGHSDLASGYGAAGSIVVILAWVYYSSTILYFGAEFTKEYSKCCGSRIQPNKYAILIEKKEITVSDYGQPVN